MISKWRFQGCLYFQSQTRASYGLIWLYLAIALFSKMSFRTTGYTHILAMFITMTELSLFRHEQQICSYSLSSNLFFFFVYSSIIEKVVWNSGRVYSVVPTASYFFRRLAGFIRSSPAPHIFPRFPMMFLCPRRTVFLLNVVAKAPLLWSGNISKHIQSLNH